MKQPKYQIGDEVWTIASNTIKQCTVTAIAITKDEVFVFAFHLCEGAGYGITFTKTESELFPTKEVAKSNPDTIDRDN